MAVSAKICGISTTDAIRAAATGGAKYVGFVFFPPSPRAVTPDHAAQLAGMVPRGIERVGLFVNPHDDDLTAAVDTGALTMIQLHGEEPPERVADIKAKFRIEVMKAISIRDRGDLSVLPDYEAVSDMILFDAKPPKEMPNALPGGNAVSFDWGLLEGISPSRPWMLAGGLNAGNIEEAVNQSGATIIDVSSGVETSPGVKDPDLILDLLARAKRL